MKQPDTELIVVAHNVRSALNVGAILRSMAGFGLTQFIASGYTPYPESPRDSRLPHVRQRAQQLIAKTALGSEQYVRVHQVDDLSEYVADQRQAGYQVVALEQAKDSTPLSQFRLTKPTILIVGNEVQGLEPAVLSTADQIIEIPLPGRKESLNVSVAAGIALYALLHSK